MSQSIRQSQLEAMSWKTSLTHRVHGRCKERSAHSRRCACGRIGCCAATCRVASRCLSTAEREACSLLVCTRTSAERLQPIIRGAPMRCVAPAAGRFVCSRKRFGRHLSADDDWPYSPQLYWQAKTLAVGRRCDWLRFRCLVSVQTHLLDTCPQISGGIASAQRRSCCNRYRRSWSSGRGAGVDRATTVTPTDRRAACFADWSTAALSYRGDHVRGRLFAACACSDREPAA